MKGRREEDRRKKREGETKEGMNKEGEEKTEREEEMKRVSRTMFMTPHQPRTQNVRYHAVFTARVRYIRSRTKNTPLPSPPPLSLSNQ